MRLFKLLLAAAAFVLAANANATLVLQFSDSADFSTNLVTLTDAGTTGTPGYVTYSNSTGALFNGWSLVSATGVSSPFLAGSQIDLNSIDVSDGTGTLYMRLSQTDFTGTGHFSALFGGTTSGTAAFSSYADASNTLFGTGTALLQSGSSTGGFSGSNAGYLNFGGPFSMTMVAAITGNGSGSTSFDTAANVPEPASLSLLGIGLLAIGFTARRKKKAA